MFKFLEYFQIPTNLLVLWGSSLYPKRHKLYMRKNSRPPDTIHENKPKLQLPTHHTTVRFPQESKILCGNSSYQTPPPRLVSLRQKWVPEPWVIEYHSTAPVPTILHVCQRSRELAMRRWQLLFGVHLSHGHTMASDYNEMPRVWFDGQEHALLVPIPTTIFHQ